MMPPDTYRNAVNATAVVASAAFAGGGLLILVSYGIRWIGTDPLVWRAGFWDEFLNFALTIIPLNLITLVGLGLSVRLDWHDRPVRRLWMWAVWLYVANTLFTLGYFIPQNILSDLGQLTQPPRRRTFGRHGLGCMSSGWRSPWRFRSSRCWRSSNVLKGPAT
jgi:hypothetical protein